jgi:geranylgeranylglycerol-phosphate geranylgeranyltransferase
MRGLIHISALWQLIRPGNVLLAALSAGVGALVGPHPILAPHSLGWAALAAGLVTAGGNVLNDVTDVAIDRVNKPHRPLPRGRVSTRLAGLWGVLLLAGALASAWPLSIVCRWIVLGSVVGVVFYDLWGKRIPLVGNLIVAVVSGLVFPFGALAAGTGLFGAIPGGLAFLMHLAREVIKDLQDEPADRTAGRRTLPIAAGTSVARRMVRMTLVVLLIALPLPHLLGWLGLGYVLVALIGVGVPVLNVLIRLTRPLTHDEFGELARILKWDMPVGLAAVLIG